MRNPNKVMQWYAYLRGRYGAPQGQWTLWCKRQKTLQEREQVIIGAILTQRTNWRNVERVVAILKKSHLFSLGAFLNAYRKNPASSALLIKSSGFYQQKAERLAGLAAFIKKRYGGVAAMRRVPLARLRTELLLLKGVGSETADSILLYAFDKPIFVIDEYTRRFLNTKFLHTKRSHFYNRSALKVTYGELQNYFQENIKKDYRLYQDFHALIVLDAKNKI